MIGPAKITEALTDEIFITALSWNTKNPNFYTKYLAKKFPALNINIATASDGSSQLPGLEAVTYKNVYEEESYLMDGAFAAAYNPAFFANIHALTFNE